MQWESQRSFVLVAIGSSIGLGNFWRFPFLVYKWGGGPFFIPYLLSLILIGIPVLKLEIALGQVYQSSILGAFHQLTIDGYNFSGIGLMSLSVTFLVLGYYCVIISWGLVYLVQSFYPILPWTFPNAEAHFVDSVLHQTHPTDLSSISSAILLACLVQWTCVYLCLCHSIKATGKIAYVTVLSPVAMLLVLLIRGCTLEGASIGIRQYIFNWDFSKLLDGNMWIDATTQVLFSVTGAFGVMCTYGSFNYQTSNIIRNASIIAYCNALFSFLSGFCVFSIVGHLTHQAGIPFSDLKVNGPGLAFVTYPTALALLPGASANIFCILFFITLFMLGIDSAFAMVDTILHILQEHFLNRSNFVNRSKLLPAVCGVGFLSSIVYTTNAGFYLIQMMDYWVNSFLFFWNMVLQCLAVGWAHQNTQYKNLVGHKTAFVFSLAVYGGYVLLVGLAFILWETTTPTITLSIILGGAVPVLAILVLVNILCSSHHRGVSLKTAAFDLALYKGVALKDHFNSTISKSELYNFDMPWVLLIVYFIPAVCTILLATQIKNIVYDLDGHPLSYQVLGTSIVLIIALSFFIPKVSPKQG